MEESIHINTTDYRGRRIVCTKRQWEEHVVGCKHHAYMEDEENAVIETLQYPDYNIRHYDVDDPNVRCYYRTSETRDYYVKVVVRFSADNGEGLGYIVTAFMPDSYKPGEKPELRP